MCSEINSVQVNLLVTILLIASVVVGDGKHKREGPCAGTKGFRAPEVSFMHYLKLHSIVDSGTSFILVFCMASTL